MAYATAQQNAVNSGAESSSASHGGLGSIQSQLNSNLSFLDNYNTLSKDITSTLGNENQWKTWGEIGGQLSSTAMTVFANSPQIDKAFGWGNSAQPKPTGG